MKLVFPSAGITGRFGSTLFGETMTHIAALKNDALTMPRVRLAKAHSPRDFMKLHFIPADWQVGARFPRRAKILKRL